MLYDIITIARKDLKEIFVQRGSLRSGITNLVIVILIMGGLFPYQMGREWLTSPVAMLSTIWMPILLSMSLVVDAFAGERERHTLETLLASRLSDQAILLGKLAASITYAMSITILGLLAGALTVNSAYPGAGFYAPWLFFGAITLALLAAGLVSGAGVLVSLHANNVRQAYQRMSLGFMVLWLPLIFAPQLLPENVQYQIAMWLQNADTVQIAAAAAGILLLIDIVLVGAAIARFQRARLILD